MKRNPDAYRKSSRSKKKAEAEQSSERRYLCERCGGSGEQPEGCWDAKQKSYTAKAGPCDDCLGEGYLGEVMSSNEKEIWNKIESLDLSVVREKMASRKSWWWNLWANLDKIEAEYRQFLFLIATNPGETVVPWSQNLDDLWHEHILDTAKYTSECMAIFGRYIHHNPHLPVGTPEQQLAFSKTKDMYRKAFGDRAKNRNSSDSECGAGCTAAMPVVFCATPACSSPGGFFGISAGCSTSSTPSCSSPSCSSSSCGSSCGGGSGCGGGCGGGD